MEDEYILLPENKERDAFEKVCTRRSKETKQDYQECVFKLLVSLLELVGYLIHKQYSNMHWHFLVQWEFQLSLLFAVGVLFTGIGGINVAGGLLVGVITTKIYHLRRKQKLLEAEKALQEEIKNLKGFFERWKTIDKVLEDDDIPKALHLLSTSQESFDVVCNKLFKELEHPLMLLEKCYVCQSLLVPQKRFANLSQENLKIPRDYKYRMMSILLII